MKWDSLLVAASARELTDRLVDARTRALHLDRGAGRAVLYLWGLTVVWGMHPAYSSLRITTEAEPPWRAVPLAGVVRGVFAPADERTILITLVRRRGRVRKAKLVLDMSPSSWNALLAEGNDDRIRTLLRPRRGKAIKPGLCYRPPPAPRRRGCNEPLSLQAWMQLLEGRTRKEQIGTLVRNVAYTSRMNAIAFIGGGPGSRSPLEEGWRRWRRWRRLRAMRPHLLFPPSGPQPYPYPLPDIAGEARDTLLDALSGSDAGHPGASLVPSELMSHLERRIRGAERRLANLRRQLHGLEDPARTRALGDLLLARLASVPRGADSVSLEDFDGGTTLVALDPACAPHENAARYYDRAARSERAARLLPPKIDRAGVELASWFSLADRARSGAVGVRELERRLGFAEPRARGGTRARKSGPSVRLPYRRFRSSLGTEIRVGRGARRNDELTFRHSAPNDIWLHARHGAGAHVVLCWSRHANPAPGDLQEAATLAALHSRSRTSASVPVDWTRRKYVRKPRGAVPGRVTIEREKTVFVTPDAELAEQLRASVSSPS